MTAIVVRTGVHSNRELHISLPSSPMNPDPSKRARSVMMIGTGLAMPWKHWVSQGRPSVFCTLDSYQMAREAYVARLGSRRDLGLSPLPL